jgi:FERM C-terminal PH-like domain
MGKNDLFPAHVVASHIFLTRSISLSICLRTINLRCNPFIQQSAVCLQGEDSVEYFLGLTPSGIVVLRNKTTVAHYYWPRIAKVYFKGRYFMLRVCDKNVSAQHGPYSFSYSMQIHNT